jgi:hypothetical protein
MMDNVIDGYNTHHNKDYPENYKRNLMTAEMLKRVEVVNPNVTQAIKEETKAFESLLIEMDKFYINECNRQIRHIAIGGWWCELLNYPSHIYLPSGKVVIEPTMDYNNNWSEGYGDGVCTTLFNNRISVTLEDELTQKEQYEEYRSNK